MTFRISRRRFVEGAILTSATLSAMGAGAATPQSPFGFHSTAEEVTAGLNLTGLNAVVTGCTTGLGLETMRVLALRGAHVIGTGRTREAAEKACAGVMGHTTPVPLELTDFASVVAAADAIAALKVPIDILVLNAGILKMTFEQVNGIEQHFVVNHLGHFILAHRLLERVVSAKQGRIVVVGSGNHRDVPPGGIQFDALDGKDWWGLGYGHSKLANGLLSLELARRLRDTSATSNCVTPGPTVTNMVKAVMPKSRLEGRKTPEEGAATQCYVATSPALRGVSGEYFADCNPAAQSSYQTDAAMARKLWDVSENMTRQYL